MSKPLTWFIRYKASCGMVSGPCSDVSNLGMNNGTHTADFELGVFLLVVAVGAMYKV